MKTCQLFSLLFSWLAISGTYYRTSYLWKYQRQCCETGTAGTITFCFSGTRTGMHYGSGSGSGTRFGWKSWKNKKLEVNFLGNKLLLTLKTEQARFFEICCFWKTVLNIVRIRNLNQSFSKVGTGTATNHYYGFRTLTKEIRNETEIYVKRTLVARHWDMCRIAVWGQDSVRTRPRIRTEYEYSE
jgi:hypothetical protein